MTYRPLISIIVSAYNEEKYLVKTLRSIKRDISRFEKPVELIVVDNNSTDKTSEIASQFTDQVLLCPDQGASEARNYGAKHAQGKNLLFLDADGEISPGFLEETLKALNQGYVAGRYNFFPDKAKPHYDALFSIGNPLSDFMTMYTPAIFCQKEVFEKTGGWDEDLEMTEEIQLQKALKKQGPFTRIKDAHVKTSVRRLEKDGFLRVLFQISVGYYFPQKINWTPKR